MYWNATYRVTTPLFLGGADPDANAELRTSALKGLLRFWFRAIALPQIKKWTEVQELENNIFG
jgi:CRISPR-associated protein Cmr1